MSKMIHVELQAGEEIVCPNCGGTGDDPETMICCLCGGEGVLSADSDADTEFDMVNLDEGEVTI